MVGGVAGTTTVGVQSGQTVCACSCPQVEQLIQRKEYQACHQEIEVLIGRCVYLPGVPKFSFNLADSIDQARGIIAPVVDFKILTIGLRSQLL